MAKIVNSCPFGKLSEERLARFERTIGYTLPDDYRAYLLEHNGGKPNPRDFSLGNDDSSGLHEVYGLHDGPDYDQLDRTWEIYRGLSPSHLPALACDPGGNEICIGLAGAQRGRVYFWDHETGATEEIAPSFAEFLAGLYEWVDPNEHAFQRICRTHDVSEVERFIASGIDLNTADEHDWSLLEYATMFGHVDIVKRLHATGAGLRRARFYAERNENAELVAFFDSVEKRGR